MIKGMIFIVLCGCLIALTGCLDTAVTGAQMVYNRKSIQNTWTDNYTTIQANRALYANAEYFPDSHININTFNNVMILTGQVATKHDRKAVVTFLKDIVNPKEIYNFLTVEPPTSSIIRVSDSWITTKINSQFVADPNIDPTAIKVITENGTVFLLGVVEPDAADIACQISRNTSGVQNVIKLFSYIHINKQYKA